MTTINQILNKSLLNLLEQEEEKPPAVESPRTSSNPEATQNVHTVPSAEPSYAQKAAYMFDKAKTHVKDNWGGYAVAGTGIAAGIGSIALMRKLRLQRLAAEENARKLKGLEDTKRNKD